MLVVIGFLKAAAMLSVPSQTRYILYALTWADTCSNTHTDTHTHTPTHPYTHTCLRCRLAFRVQCVSWKIGLKAKPVARWLICHIWYFFFFVLFSFHAQSVYVVYKIFKYYLIMSPANIAHTLLQFTVIISESDFPRLDTLRNRELTETEHNVTKHRADKHWDFKNFMWSLQYAFLLTSATIADLFSMAPTTRSPTHHSHICYTQNPQCTRKTQQQRNVFFK